MNIKMPILVHYVKNGLSKYKGLNTEKKSIYGFEVCNDRIIRKFAKIPSKNHPVIVLPDLNATAKAPNKSRITFENYDLTAHNYIHGNVVLKNDCFKGHKNLTILVPTNKSIVIDDGAFDIDAKVKFILPKGMTIRTYEDNIAAENKNYTIIMDKKFNYDVIIPKNNARCFTKKYVNKEGSAKLTIDKNCLIVNGEIIGSINEI